MALGGGTDVRRIRGLRGQPDLWNQPGARGTANETQPHFLTAPLNCVITSPALEGPEINKKKFKNNSISSRQSALHSSFSARGGVLNLPSFPHQA